MSNKIKKTGNSNRKKRGLTIDFIKALIPFIGRLSIFFFCLIGSIYLLTDVKSWEQLIAFILLCGIPTALFAWYAIDYYQSELSVYINRFKNKKTKSDKTVYGRNTPKTDVEVQATTDWSLEQYPETEKKKVQKAQEWLYEKNYNETNRGKTFYSINTPKTDSGVKKKSTSLTTQQQGTEKRAAQEELDEMNRLLDENNMHEIAVKIGYEQDFLQNGPHWEGKWNIGPYMAALEKQSRKEEAERKRTQAEYHKDTQYTEAERKEAEYRQLMVDGLSKHKVHYLRELWSDSTSYCSGRFYETSFREVEVTTTEFEKAFLYAEGQRYFIVLEIRSCTSTTAVPNCAGWTYQDDGGKTYCCQELYEINGDIDKDDLRRLVQKKFILPCATRNDNRTQYLFDDYFKQIEAKK